MKVTVSVPGKFEPAFQWARWLESRGELDRLVSPLPHGRTEEFGVTRARTRTIAPIGGWNYAFQRFGPRAWQAHNQIAVSVAFDATAAGMLGDCDVFNGWGSTSLRTIRAAHRRGVPVVLTVASSHIETQTAILRDEYARWGEETPLTHPRVIERMVEEYAEADVIVAPCRWVVESFVARGVGRQKMRLIPWGARAVAAPVDRAGRTTPRFLFAGRCEVRKGVPYLLEAFRRLRTPSTLCLTGQPDADLVRRAGGLPENTDVTGLITGEAFARQFRQADVFVLPSVEDGSALVTIWALAAGLPVIATDRSGADLVRDGVNGYIVPAADAAALADRMERLAFDEGLRLRMSAAAAASVRDRTWDDYGAEAYSDVYAPLHESQRRYDHARAA